MKLTSPLLEALLSAEREHESALADIRGRIRDERIRLIFESHKIRIGSIVERDGKTNVVTGLSRLDWDTPWAHGHPMKKDGTFSKQEQHLFSEWKVIAP